MAATENDAFDGVDGALVVNDHGNQASSSPQRATVDTDSGLAVSSFGTASTEQSSSKSPVAVTSQTSEEDSPGSRNLKAVSTESGLCESPQSSPAVVNNAQLNDNVRGNLNATSDDADRDPQENALGETSDDPSTLNEDVADQQVSARPQESIESGASEQSTIRKSEAEVAEEDDDQSSAIPSNETVSNDLNTVIHRPAPQPALSVSANGAEAVPEASDDDGEADAMTKAEESFGKLKEELEQLKCNMSVLKDKLDLMQSELKKSSAELKKSKADYEDKLVHINEAIERSDENAESIDSLTNEHFEELRKVVKSRVRTLSELESEVSILRKENSSLQQELQVKDALHEEQLWSHNLEKRELLAMQLDSMLESEQKHREAMKSKDDELACWKSKCEQAETQQSDLDAKTVEWKDRFLKLQVQFDLFKNRVRLTEAWEEINDSLISSTGNRQNELAIDAGLMESGATADALALISTTDGIIQTANTHDQPLDTIDDAAPASLQAAVSNSLFAPLVGVFAFLACLYLGASWMNFANFFVLLIFCLLFL